MSTLRRTGSQVLGSAPPVAMTLSRHSDIPLTMRHRTDVSPVHLQGAIERIGVARPPGHQEGAVGGADTDTTRTQADQRRAQTPVMDASPVAGGGSSGSRRSIRNGPLPFPSGNSSAIARSTRLDRLY